MKRIKTSRVFLTLALAVIMCLGSMTSALAAQGPITGTETNPALAVITKTLQMPDGTTTPVETFAFAFAAKDVDGDNSAAAQATMPAITGKSVGFTSSNTGSTSGGLKTVTGETASLFDGVTWPHAGVYTYTVTETAGSTAGMTYSQASYDISVYVANNAAGTGLYVAAIGTTVLITDDGTTGSGKTDPTTSTSVNGAYSAMMFTNTYIETPTVVDPTLGDALSISKTVSGDYGNKDTLYFTFTVNVTKAALVLGTPTYKVYVMEGTTVATITSANYSGTILSDSYGTYVNVTAGTALNINLKHGQRLAFMGLPTGTTYSVTETGTTDYTPIVSVVANGGSPTVTNGTVSTSLTALNAGSSTIIIGAGSNSAAYTNTYKTVTPTGISLNNLPFILMIVLAAGGLVTFVIVKSRKRASNH